MDRDDKAIGVREMLPGQAAPAEPDAERIARLEQALTFLTTHDPVTGLPSATLFEKHLEQALAAARQPGRALALLSLSIDNLAQVNESLGHAPGDEFLRIVSQRLARCMQADDFLAREGGNEFSAVLHDDPEGERAGACCERIRAALAEDILVAHSQVAAEFSAGIALAPRFGCDPQHLQRFAALARVQARDEGRNHSVYFVQSMSQRLAELDRAEAALGHALAREELELIYEPVLDLRSGAICALSACTSWKHPDFPLPHPERHGPLAEDSDLTAAYCSWVLRRACRDMQAWEQDGLAPLPVALRLSAQQLRDTGLAALIAARLAEAKIAPQRLLLEVDESALVQDPEAAARALGAMRALGVGLTLDEFGLGAASLSHLKQFPLDRVKIHHKLTGDVASGAGDAALASNVIAMAHTLGLQVGAANIETEAQCEFLRDHMCDQVQGSFFSAPVGAAEIGAMLAAGRALPAAMLRIRQRKRTLLLVDDEQNIVSSLKRLLRADGYQILSANSGQEGLEVLAANEVDVIVSDQRMPGMLGADFLRAAKDLYPHTIRIMLSGYTELQSVTDAVNEGAIYKFLTKPWEDALLRGHIADAFRLKEIDDDNERLHLALRTANHELATANRKMEELLQQKQRQITTDKVSLNVTQELLQYLPLAIIGLDDAGMVAFVNAAADTLFAAHGGILGAEAAFVLPELFDGPEQARRSATIGARHYDVQVHPMGSASESRGSLITISASEAQP